MAFWSTEKFEHAGSSIVAPYNRAHLKHGAYELALGAQAFITSEGTKQELKPGNQLVIPSGQFGLLLTEESVSIPADVIGFISIRATIKFGGLVNVSGFHVDPGFQGKLKFAVYNAGSRDIVLERGQRIFMLWLSDLDRVTSDSYSGHRQQQASISAGDVQELRGEVASPAALKKELLELRTETDKRFASIDKDFTHWKAMAAAIILLLVGLYLQTCFASPQPSSDEPAVSQPTPSAQ